MALELIPKEEVPAPISVCRRRFLPDVPLLKLPPFTPYNPFKFVKSISYILCVKHQLQEIVHG